MARALNYTWYTAMPLSHLGWLALLQRDLVRARAYFEESLKLFQSLHSKWGSAWAIYSLGQLAVEEGDLDTARRHFRESLMAWHEAEDRRRVIFALEGLASITGAEADLHRRLDHGNEREPQMPARTLARRTARLWGAAEATRDAIGVRDTPYDLFGRADRVAAARSCVDDESWLKAWDEGRAMALEQAVTYALS